VYIHTNHFVTVELKILGVKAQVQLAVSSDNIAKIVTRTLKNGNIIKLYIYPSAAGSGQTDKIVVDIVFGVFVVNPALKPKFSFFLTKHFILQLVGKVVEELFDIDQPTF